MDREKEHLVLTMDGDASVNNRTDSGNPVERKTAGRRATRGCSRWIGIAIMPILIGAAPPPAPPITMSAFLMSSETGRLSPDALTHPELLGNAVAGAASAHAALVRVKVAAGRGAALSGDVRVRLVARVSGGRAMVGGAKGQPAHVILDRTVRLGPAGADGNAYAGFWLDDVGCAPVALDATLLAAKPLHGHADLGFQCYE
jgi:hypothetical protein